MNSIIPGSLAQERDKGNGVEVLVNILDRSLFGDRDDICLFPSYGSRLSRKEVFRMSMVGGAKRSALSFKSCPGILSGPCGPFCLGLVNRTQLSKDR